MSSKSANLIGIILVSLPLVSLIGYGVYDANKKHVAEQKKQQQVRDAEKRLNKAMDEAEKSLGLKK